MIIKMNNKSEHFYEYMGKIFGSRIIEKQTNDRIYDDNDKQWYLFLENERVMAFVSISENKIKNLYTVKEKYLEQLLKEIKKEVKIEPSIVTNHYCDVYEKCNFKVNEGYGYRNFISIYEEQ